jgi:uncharacterized membrane protein YoaK (UPF0700 family)
LRAADASQRLPVVGPWITHSSDPIGSCRRISSQGSSCSQAQRSIPISRLLPLAAFLAGAGSGGVLASRLAQRHAQHTARAPSIEVLLVALAAILAAAIEVRANAVSGDAVIALLAFAMGVRNATIRRVAVPDLTTTVLTMTLTGLAADSQLFGGSGKGSVRRTTAVLAMLLGALAGALLLKTSLFLPLALPATLAFITVLAYPPAARREERSPG